MLCLLVLGPVLTRAAPCVSHYFQQDNTIIDGSSCDPPFSATLRNDTLELPMGSAAVALRVPGVPDCVLPVSDDPWIVCEYNHPDNDTLLAVQIGSTVYFSLGDNRVDVLISAGTLCADPASMRAVVDDDLRIISWSNTSAYATEGHSGFVTIPPGAGNVSVSAVMSASENPPIEGMHFCVAAAKQTPTPETHTNTQFMTSSNKGTTYSNSTPTNTTNGSATPSDTTSVMTTFPSTSAEGEGEGETSSGVDATVTDPNAGSDVNGGPNGDSGDSTAEREAQAEKTRTVVLAVTLPLVLCLVIAGIGWRYGIQRRKRDLLMTMDTHDEPMGELPVNSGLVQEAVTLHREICMCTPSTDDKVISKTVALLMMHDVTSVRQLCMMDPVSFNELVQSTTQIGVRSVLRSVYQSQGALPTSHSPPSAGIDPSILTQGGEAAQAAYTQQQANPYSVATFGSMDTMETDGGYDTMGTGSQWSEPVGYQAIVMGEGGMNGALMGGGPLTHNQAPFFEQGASTNMYTGEFQPPPEQQVASSTTAGAGSSANAAPAKKYKWSCHLCHQTFARRARMKEHLLAKHGIGERLKCPECDRTFVRAENVRVHMKSHHNK